MNTPDWLPDNALGWSIGGAVGGLSRWLTLKLQAVDGVTAVVIGGASAAYLGPVIVPWMAPIAPDNATASQIQFAGAYLIGLGGTLLLQQIMDYIRLRRFGARIEHAETTTVLVPASKNDMVEARADITEGKTP